jgi:hypothetical protein
VRRSSFVATLAASTIVSLAQGLCPRTAKAQAESQARPNGEAPSSGEATGSTTPAAPSSPANTDGAWRWSLAAWSPERQESSFELHYALVDFRPIGSPLVRWSQGSEFALGTRATAIVLPFRLTWTSDPTLRILDSKSFAFSIVQTVRLGLALGPIEPEIGGGVSTFTIDDFHANFSVQMFSPRVAAAIWAHLGNLRLGVEAYSEYLWRWLGDSNYLLRGLEFELSVGGVRGADGSSGPSR